MTATATAARPATFDRSTQRRRSIYAKAQIAKKQLGLSEDLYRQIVFDQCGCDSLKDASDTDLAKLMDHLERRGFKPLPKAGAPKSARHPVALKARALWISLHHLGVVKNPSEQALEAFAKRQLGCEKLVWARQSHGHKLIEALKNMAVRNGWRQTHVDSGRPLSVSVLQTHLCEVILAKLKRTETIPADWTLNDAAMRLGGMDLGADGPMTVSDYIDLAKLLGDELRAVRGTEGAI